MFEDFKVKLDYGKAIIICDDNLNLDSFRSDIRPKIMILKSNPEKLYGLDSYDFRIEYKSEIFKKIEDLGFNIINITEMIRGKIKDILDEEIDKFIKENINNIDYITDFSIDKHSNYESISFDFMREANYFGKDTRNDEETLKSIDIYINKVNEGIIKLGTDRYSNYGFEYNLETNKFNIENKEIMRNIYSERQLKVFLAYEQYKQGKTPAIYNEIAKINNFLEDKKSVIVELHNGTKIKAETYLGSILDIRDNGEIYIADRYSNKIIEGYPINSYECLGTQLKCLKYGRNVLPIQSNVLENLSTEKMRKFKESKEEEEEVQ